MVSENRGTLRWGPFYKGVLLFGDLYWGSPIFVPPSQTEKGLRASFAGKRDFGFWDFRLEGLGAREFEVGAQHV